MSVGGLMPKLADAAAGRSESENCCLSASNSLLLVTGPAMPSSTSRFERWKSMTRAFVFGPKMPSTASGASRRMWKLRTSCRAGTSAPTSPVRSVRGMAALPGKPVIMLAPAAKSMWLWSWRRSQQDCSGREN
jgi:hypothetical protein